MTIRSFLHSRPRPRPLWQRVVFPMLGLALVILGIVGCVFPIVPGIPFLLVGLPLVFCFSHRWETRSRELMQTAIERCGHRFRRWRRKE